MAYEPNTPEQLTEILLQDPEVPDPIPTIIDTTENRQLNSTPYPLPCPPSRTKPQKRSPAIVPYPESKNNSLNKDEYEITKPAAPKYRHCSIRTLPHDYDFYTVFICGCGFRTLCTCTHGISWLFDCTNCGVEYFPCWVDNPVGDVWAEAVEYEAFYECIWCENLNHYNELWCEECREAIDSSAVQQWKVQRLVWKRNTNLFAIDEKGEVKKVNDQEFDKFTRIWRPDEETKYLEDLEDDEDWWWDAVDYHEYD